MAVTVRKLISMLKKMPPTAHVVWRDHDQSEDELNGFLNNVEEAPDALYEARSRVNGREENWGHDPKRKIVVLSP